MLVKRIAYSLYMMLRYQRQLGQIRHCPEGPTHTHQVCANELKLKGISVLVLDFDGVLAAHGEPMPSPEAETWLRECVREFGPEQVFILSNKPLPERIAHFAAHYPGVRCIKDTRKKPYPDGLLAIIRLTGADPGQIMLLDDRLLTGALAACIAGVRTTYISRPYVNLGRRPASELFFMSLRGLERLALTGLWAWRGHKIRDFPRNPMRWMRGKPS